MYLGIIKSSITAGILTGIFAGITVLCIGYSIIGVLLSMLMMAFLATGSNALVELHEDLVAEEQLKRRTDRLVTDLPVDVEAELREIIADQHR